MAGSARSPQRGAERGRIRSFGLVTIAALGGIGFTVSLLMNELAFAGDRAGAAEGTLAVLLGSARRDRACPAFLVSGALRRRNRRLHPHPQHPHGEPAPAADPELSRQSQRARRPARPGAARSEARRARPLGRRLLLGEQCAEQVGDPAR